MKLRTTTQQGSTLAIVLILSVALLMLVTVLFFRSRAQRDTFAQLELQAKALAAARGIMQMALYKFRVLPTEFYQVASATKGIDPKIASFVQEVWLAEMDSSKDGPIAKRLTDSLKQVDGRNYRVGINRFDLVTKEDSGYRRDFVKIETWGQCENEKKVIEELIEVEITH